MMKKHVIAYYKWDEDMLVVDAWDDDNAQYPLLWNQKYIDYDEYEVKNLVYERCKEKLKEPFIFEWCHKR